MASDAENAKTYYHYASNEPGSVTHVVDDRDVLNHYEYDVWGNLAVCEEAVPNRFLFTGQQYDGTIQQYYLRARFYNPAVARFTQEDTYRGDGQNLYTYCRNNPVCYVDPSGHCSKDPDGNQAGSGDNGELLLPAVIPTQPQLPAVIDTPQKQLSAVIDTPQKQLPAVIDNYQNGINGPEANTPNNQNRTNSSEGSIPSGYYQDADGRWRRPNGQFASNAEVGIDSPVKVSTESHGNSLSDPRTNYGYVLVNKDTNEILKFGEILHPKTRYSKNYLEQNNAVMKVLESGSKEDIHYWQYDMNKYFGDKYKEFPRLLNSKGW